MTSRRSAKKERIKEALNPEGGSASSLSGELVACAFYELRAALAEGHGPVYVTTNNHSSRHSLASIILLVAGFEAWLNEVMLFIPSLPVPNLSTQNKHDILHHYSPIHEYEALAQVGHQRAGETKRTADVHGD